MKSKFWANGTVRKNLISEMAWELQRRGYMPKTDVGWNEFIETFCIKHENWTETAPYYLDLSDKGYNMLKKAVYTEARRLEEVELAMRREAQEQLVKTPSALMSKSKPPFAIQFTAPSVAIQFYGIVESAGENGPISEYCWMIAIQNDKNKQWVPKYAFGDTDDEARMHMAFGLGLQYLRADTAEEALATVVLHIDQVLEKAEENDRKNGLRKEDYNSRQDDIIFPF